ncbi:MAG TPA: cysteine hydrolase family protein [Candidatus Polarisedimenticolia bacterium]|nr:cysteine hydrolase family protein [Candidatus Polarisedimenticolia bacterium]
MPATVFWDVDTQHDFIMPDGKLYVRGAEGILPKLQALTEFAHGRGVPVLGSVDYHSMEDREISDTPDFRETYPPHCLIDTPGQEKVPATRPRQPLWIDSRPEDKDALKRRVRDHLSRGGEVLFRKQQFDVFSNPNVDTVLEVVRPDRVVVYGVALDVCNRFAVEGLLARKRYRVALVQDASQAIRPEEGQALLLDWAARGVSLLSTDQVIGGALGV